MTSRLELQEKLEELLDSRNVYFDPPENLKMKYPCIRYSISRIESDYANNKKYMKNNRYEIIVIDHNANNEVVDKILELSHSSHDRHYVADGMHHDVITLYY